MVPNKLVLAALAVACVAAAAGGGYLANRQNAAASLEATSAAGETSAPPLADPAPADGGVGPSFSSGALAQPAPVHNETANANRPARHPAKGSTAESAASPAAAPAARPARKTARAAAAAAAERTPLEHAAPPAAAAVVPPFEAAAPPAPPADRLQEPVAAAPPEPDFVELVVPADSVIGLQMETTISTERARVEDPVEARVVRDVRAGGEVAIPAGSRALGSVMLVERGGKFKERARLGIRFHTLVLADGSRLPISTESIYRYGEAPGNSSAAKIGGGAVAGAILGAIIGGAKGAAVGATAGAGGGTAVVVAGEPNAASFPRGSEVTARLIAPVAVTLDR